MREILGKFHAKGRPVLEFGAYTDVQGSTFVHAESISAMLMAMFKK